ncbi:MAG: hypothetical protein ACODAQ_09475 [Phycisphaeraceae bacterium]
MKIFDHFGRMLVLLAALGLTGGLTLGCEEQGPAEEAGEQVDEGMEDTGEQMEEAGEEMEGAADDAMDN